MMKLSMEYKFIYTQTIDNKFSWNLWAEYKH